MKKSIIFLIPVVLWGLTIFTGCPHPIQPELTPVPTPFVLLDDFADGDNRTDTLDFGGYWYTFDDAAAQFSVTSQCGNSGIWPVSDSVAQQTPNCTPTFILSNYVAASETPPANVTSPNFARVYGNVDRSATGYVYGFAGFGANLLDVAGDGFKNTLNASARGYKRLQFWYKNGPTVSGPKLWKVKLPTSAVVGGGPCTMREVDNVPVCNFTSSDTWQKFDKSLTADFAPESGWGSTACGTDGTLTACAGLVNGISYYDGTGSQYKCNAADALAALNAIQWQTNFGGTSAVNAFDLEIAQIAFIR